MSRVESTAAAESDSILESKLQKRYWLTHELLLALVLLAEIVLFSVVGTNFLSGENAFLVVRLAVEIGLLAVAMTPVIVTGGIDLSVGSLMGLSAVLFGMLWHTDYCNLPISAAIAGTLVAGFLAGCLNALLIARFRLPPLIVTLGTFSLFRGLAEGLTHGTMNFTGLPERFLFIGQGFFAGGIPAQLPIFVVVIVAFWIMLQRTTIGRGLYAIGFSHEGAQYAGIPVSKRLALVYILSGVVSSLAAIIYVAHSGQAKADAGTGFELSAITAVVLGGTSIFGGRGTIQGTVLGMFAIVVLQNGLRLADQPAELAGILMGGLLLVTISMERISNRARRFGASTHNVSEEFEVKNSQVAALGLVIIVGALIVAGSNWLLVRNLLPQSNAQQNHSSESTSRVSENSPTPAKNNSANEKQGNGATEATLVESSAGNTLPKANGTSPANKKITVAMMPKSKGNAYFVACHKGAQEAADQLNIDLIWDGPTEPDPVKQSEIVDTWITRGVDVIAVAVENRAAISSVLRKARDRGIKVLTWDADAEPNSRDFFVNQATAQGIGYTLMDHAGRLLDGKGEFAIITASLTAANMIEWQKYIEERRAEKYPNIKMATIRPCDDLQKKAFDETNTILNAYPDVKLIMAICSPGVPGAAEAVKQAGRNDVKVIGLGLPNENKIYVHDGVTESVVLWNTMDLGYLTIYAADALVKGTLKAGDHTLKAERLGAIEVSGDNILLGTPFTFNQSNIDKFDF